MSELVISVGSNYGDKVKSVEEAVSWLSSFLFDFKSSGIYKTPAVGNSSGEYINCVVSGIFSGKTEEFNEICKVFEIESGRNEERRKRGEVPIDIDIVIADCEIVKNWDYNQEFFKRGFKKIGIIK